MREKRMGKRWLFIALVAVLTAALAGCGGGKTAENAAPAAATKPAETAATETKPAAETKTAETAATETKPADAPVVATRSMPMPETGTGVAVEGPAGWEISAIAGDWYSLDSADALTIYENGGFNLYWGADDHYYDGYLVYTEAAGATPWEDGPRYALYLENNEPFPGVWLSVEPDDPELMALCQGGGAVRLQRMGVAASNGAVRVAWASDVSLPPFDRFNAVSSGDGVAVAFFAENGPVKNFRVVSLFLKDMSPEGVPTFLYETLYTQETLTPERPLVVDFVFYGDIPNNGILYTDENGVDRLFAVEMSGRDGSIYLLEV